MNFAFAPLSYTLPYWPEHLFGNPDFLDRVGISDFKVTSVPGTLSMSGTLSILHSLEIKLPALDGVSVVFFPAAADVFTSIPLAVDLAPDFAVTLTDIDVSLRIQSSLLRAVEQSGGVWIPLVDAQSDPLPVAVTVSGAKARVSADGDIDIQAFTTMAMTAVAIGDTGIVIEVLGVALHLSDQTPPPAGAPPGFKGVYIDGIAVHLDDSFEGFGGPDTITAQELFIGSSGFAGTVGAQWSAPPTGRLFGLTFKPKSIDIAFAQNKFTGMGLKGELTLPFFDTPLNVEIAYDADGGVTVGIDAASGIFTLTKPGFLEIAVKSIEIEVHGKAAVVRISGILTPLYAGVDWPSFEMRELSIDSEGRVKLDSGWIDLPEQKALNFHAFTVEITKFGLGRTDGGGRWLGFSGKVNLIKGVKGNASVEGLRITLNENGSTGIGLDGVGVDMKVAGAFELKGSVKFTEDNLDKRFDGAAMLALKKPELVFDTRLTIGHRNDPVTQQSFSFFAMYGGLELPLGVPLGPSGAALFGFAGLLALQMRPLRLPDQPWYALPPNGGWYNATPVGVAEFTKWGPEKDAKAFGAGLTIGTYADNGFTFNARALLVLSFPGPLLMIEGRGNILKDRKALASGEEPLFRAIAVLDQDAGEYTFGLDAFYKYDKTDGGVIEIRGSLEAYYKKSDPRAWHIWLGKDEPRASRIQANILSLFTASSYFMIDADSIRTGAWIGYDKTWDYTPLTITLEAWLEANAGISFKPNHFHADLWLHAAIRLSAFGVGAGLAADARLDADVMDPFHIKGELSVTLELPWPLKDISRDVTLEWGPRGSPPPVPIMLQTVGIEHFNSSVVWPLAVNGPLQPSHDDGDGYLIDPPPAPGPPSDVPTVPMDARPSIAFGRAVHDDAKVGLNALPRTPEYDQIGDPSQGQGPAKARFSLQGVVLEKWQADSASWVQVAGKGAGALGLPPLYGSWGAIPGSTPGSVDQTKLQLWARTGFHQTRMTGDDWNDWFADAYPHYPCIDDAPPLRCYDFEGYESARVLGDDSKLIDNAPHRLNPDIIFGTQGGWVVETMAAPIQGRTRALRTLTLWGGSSYGFILLASLASVPGLLHVVFDSAVPRSFTLLTQDAAGAQTSQSFTSSNGNLQIAVPDKILGLVIFQVGQVGIVEICLGAGARAKALDPSIEDRQALAANLKSGTSVWSAQGQVLEPNTDYRLVIATEATVVGAGAGVRSQTSHAHFRTGGPPALGGFTIPDTQTQQSIDAGPDNLATYVEQTIPATQGQDADDAPAMPRPVFRAYDVGVAFNADYVDLLYKMAHRDLRLQILDSNGAPARDDIGRALTFENAWGVTSDLKLDASSMQWLSMVDLECLPIDPTLILHNQTLGTAGVPMLLDPTTRYRARLTPLLMHEDFAAPRHADAAQALGTGGRVGDWRVVELDTVAQASRWTVTAVASASGTYVLQDLPLAGGASAATVCPPGSALVWSPLAGQPAWKSQRLSAYVSSAASAAVGLIFLFQHDQAYFEVGLHQANAVCRLVRRTGASENLLAEAPLAFAASSDVELVVEVSDTAIRVFADGTAVLTHAIDLVSHPGGTVGLWCWNNPAARFKDVKVEDQSGKAATAFSFEFVTSDYVNYFHLAQARRTPVWDIETQSGDKDRSVAQLAPMTSAAVTLSDASLTATEVRQYEDLMALWLGPDFIRDPVTPDIHRILRGGEPLGWIVRSPEPWDWKRSLVTLQHAIETAPLSQVLGPVKITGAALGQAVGDDEYVDLLILEAVSLAGWRLEMRDGSSLSSGLIDLPFVDPAPLWLPLHSFTDAETIKAGFQIRLYSGGLVRSPTNHTSRAMNVAPPGDPGLARLPAAGADLRLIDPKGRTACAVRILPDGAFSSAAQSVRLLRKADATGLIVLPNAGDAFAAGAYRLAMTYRKNVTANDPDSVVLSQAGDSSDEQASVSLY